MAKIKFDNLVDEVSKIELKNQVKAYSKAGKDAMKEIREGIVNAWFGEFNSDSVNASTDYTAYTTYFSNNTAQVVINSYVNLDRYVYNHHTDSADRWRANHPKYAGKWDSSYYVLVHLQMVEGIIGLPEETTARLDEGYYWENKHFHQRDKGLRDEIFNSPRWNDWNEIINKHVKKYK